MCTQVIGKLFIRAMDKQTLLDVLRRRKTFVMTYRIMTEHGPSYVTLKTSRMKDNDRSIVLGVTDVDEQMMQQ